MSEQISPEDWAKSLKARDEISKINKDLDKDEPYSLGGDGDKGDPEELDREEKAKKETLQNALGYHTIPMSSLPTLGRFYPKGSTISIRALTVQEIRHWSTVDDSQPLDVNTHLNQIVLSCCNLKDSQNKSLGYQQLCDADRLFILLSIRDLTYKNGEAKIDIPVRCNCGATEETKIPLRHEAIVLHDELPENLERYYDSEERAFVIKSRTYGKLLLHPPRVGVMEKVYAHISEYEQQKKSWDKSFYITLPYLITNPKLLDDQKSYNRIYNEFQTWEGKKFSIYQKMIEELKMGPTEKIKGTCSKQGCNAEVIGDLTFPDGIRSLFLVSNIDDELL